MKKLSPVLLVIIFAISCSNNNDDSIKEVIDDSQNEKEDLENENSDEKEDSEDIGLTKVIQKGYFNNEHIRTIHFIFEGGIIEVDSTFGPGNELAYHNDWIYDEGNKLLGTRLYLADGTLQHTNEYSYDSQGKLIGRNTSEEQGSYITDVSFEHHTDSIVCTKNFDGSISEKTFYLNESGKIYRELDGENIFEIEYMEGTVKSLTAYGEVINFSYSNETSLNEPSNNFLLSVLGTENNIVLWEDNLRQQATSLSSGFLIREENENGNVRQYDYTFDENGHPLSRKTYWNEELQSESQYFYE